MTFFIILFNRQIVGAFSDFLNTLITNKLIIIILFGMFGAITSIAMKLGNLDPVKPFERSIFISIIWRKIFIGAWSSILANYFFTYTAEKMNPILMMLVWFSAGFSERFIVDVVDSTMKRGKFKAKSEATSAEGWKGLSTCG